MTSHEIEVPSDYKLEDLKSEITKIFNLAENLQILKIKRDSYFIRICSNYPLDFYNSSNDNTIYVENLKDLNVLQKDIEKSPEVSFMEQNENEFDLNEYFRDELRKLLEETKVGNIENITSILNEIPDYCDIATQNLIKERKKTLFNELGLNGLNALHIAILVEQENVVRFYKERNANFNSLTINGWSPLMLAVKQNSLEICKIILSVPDINVQLITLQGNAIKTAELNNNNEIKHLLIDHKSSDQKQISHLENNENNLKPDKFNKNLNDSYLEYNPLHNDKIPIITGYIYKIGNLLVSGGNTRYLVLNYMEGTLIRYKKKEDYPLKPKEILPLRDIKYMQRIQASWYMKKDMHYFEINYQAKQIIGCKYLSTLKKWMHYINQATIFSNDIENKLKNINFRDNEKLKEIAKLATPKNDKINNDEILEILDICRDEDLNKAFFRKNKLIPNLEIKKLQNHNLHTNISEDILCKSSSYGSMLLIEQNSLLFEQSIEKVNFDSFELLRLIGTGSFGKIFLVKKKDDGQLFAMKVLKKRNLVTKKHLKYALTEVNILKTCDNPFIIKIHYSFQTPRYFYIVIDYCPRGDIMNELSKKSFFSEDVARFYIAELILAIEYLHKKNIIYRDLKPENILIDIEGHIKLIDFGLAKEGIGDEDKTKSFCGSPAYLSPEVLKNKNKGENGYGKSTDIYGVGAVLYEFLVGQPPFFAADIMEIFEKIEEAKLIFPKNISPEAKDLIKKLIHKDPFKRIGVKEKNDIKKHPFFKHLDFERVYNKDYDPPFDVIEITEEMKKPDKNLKFNDQNYEKSNFNINRIPEFSFTEEKKLHLN